MATIVQPYNSWREQLALSVLGNTLGNALGDLWQQYRQNEQNKKINAFKNQLSQNLQQTQPEQNISLLPSLQPQDNSDGWANAFHKTDSPLLNFDTATAPAVQAQTPSIAEIARQADSLAATKRFSMLNPDTVKGIKDTLIQQSEAQRMKDLQDSYANLFGDAKTPEEQMRALVLGNMRGAVPSELLKSFSPYANHMTISPQQQFENNLSIQKLAEEIRRNEMNDATTRYGIDTNAETQRLIHNTPVKWQDTREKAIVDQVNFMNKSIDTRISELQSQLDNTDDNNAAELLRQQITELRTARNKNEQYALSITAGMNPYRSSGSNNGEFFFNGTSNNGGQYSDLINKYSEKYDVDPDLVAAIMTQESGGNSRAISSAGAQGLMQLMPATAKQLGVSDPFDPEQNIEAGIRYLSQQLNDPDFNGDVELALRAYNAGPAATKAGRYPTETQKYVRSIMANYRKLKSKRNSQASKRSTQNSPAPVKTASKNSVIPALGEQTTSRPSNVFVNNNGDVITQEQFDSLVKKAAENGYGSVWVSNELRKKGFKPFSKKEVPHTSPLLNWLPSYMRGNNQGTALTAPAPIPVK